MPPPIFNLISTTEYADGAFLIKPLNPAVEVVVDYNCRIQVNDLDFDGTQDRIK